MYRRAADLEALQTTLVDQPAGGEFDRTVGLRIARHIRMLLQQGGGFFRADDGVLKKLPTLPSTLGLGSLLLRIAHTASETSLTVASRPWLSWATAAAKSP